MADFVLKYGNGKTASLCLTANNYGKDRVAIFNAYQNKEVISKIDTFYNTALMTDITDTFDSELLYEKGIRLKERGVSAILVDNAHFLNPFDVKQLYLIAKTLNIRVVCYADRYHDELELEGAVRLFELANVVDRNDCDHNISCITPTTTFIYGAMGSKKTASLLITGRHYEEKGKIVRYVKPILDRDPLMINSRAGIGIKADVALYQNSIINPQDFINCNIILVDEAQFLTPSQIDSLIDSAKKNKIEIVFYGLKTDFQTKTFPGSKRLFFVADSFRKLDYYCKCKECLPAEFNARTDLSGNFIREGDQVAIDGQNCSYTSLCSCYIQKVWGYGKNPKKLVRQLEREKRY